METRVDKPNPAFKFHTTTSTARHFRHRRFLTVDLTVYELQVPVKQHHDQLPGVASGRFNFWLLRPRQEVGYRTGASPWGVAVLVVVLLAQRPQQPTTVATNASVPAILESANIY
ncbi:hypothetical protein RJ639_037835 [Escallonia herrerae]|uniref:Uncharacterized protein n=1 Tax=Escallonia herrerae TaxID=1293975 RepID=A0AA88WX78_9ASTE|nr:hypothetical protein RJ639_037835 [Escallonia herrerae]